MRREILYELQPSEPFKDTSSNRDKPSKLEREYYLELGWGENRVSTLETLTPALKDESSCEEVETIFLVATEFSLAPGLRRATPTPLSAGSRLWML